MTILYLLQYNSIGSNCNLFSLLTAHNRVKPPYGTGKDGVIQLI
jgi:hypothetical protein